MIENATIKQRIEQFDLKHGPSVYDGRWIWYANGANRDGHPLGPLNEPPADPRQRHRNIVRYYETMLRHKVREFDDLKRQLTENPGLFPDMDENVERLRRLQRTVRHRQRQLQTAQEELKRLSPGYRTPEEEEENQRRMAATAEAKQHYLDTLKGINI